MGQRSRDCLPAEIGRQMNSRNVIATFARLILEHDVTKHIRSEDGC